MKKLILIVWCLLATSLTAHAATLINGAGATFPYPIYSKWFDLYHRAHPEFQFNYQSIGSGGGIRQITSQTVDFGASDGPMTDAQLKKAPGIIHIPTVMGAVAVTYNVPEIAVPLKLNGTVLADIFLGKIKKWNDSQIQALNPGVSLPNKYILVVHRSDGSGTTYIFTDYLNKVSPAWDEIGHGTAVAWPAGVGGKGNEGVMGLVRQLPGAVGYVELAYALHNRLPVAELQNAAGEFVAPSTAAVTAAAAGAITTMPADFRTSITNAPGSGVYPISGFTYLLLYDPAKDPVKGRAMIEFLKWAMRVGQTFAAPLHYAPLPPALVQQVDARINRMK